MADGFTKHEVVPDVVDKAPSASVKVTFDSGVSADQGNVLTPTQVQNKPSVEYEADSNSFYTLAMIGKIMYIFNHFPKAIKNFQNQTSMKVHQLLFC